METFFEFLVRGIQVSAPIAFASIGGVFSSRSGIINIALEGIMIVTTFAIVWGALMFQSYFMGVLVALIAGMLVALIHAVVTVTYRVNQIVSGVAINILAVGIARFSSQRIFGQETQSPSNPFGPPELFGANVVALALIPIAILAWYVLFKTPFGLRLRAVGENPKAADTVGIDVYAMRYAGVIISGLLVGLSAATLYPAQWVSGMTGGRGYIALAAMIFGRWHPIGAVIGALLFGYADTFRIMFETQIEIPGQFVQMLPYALAIIVLAGAVGRARPPAAEGFPYEKGET